MALQQKYLKQKMTLLTAALQTAEDPKEKEQIILEHLKEIDGNNIFEIKPEFPRDVEWFNSGPLSFSGALKGKVVILDFFTYCCINCLHILPDLGRLEKEFSVEAGAVVVGVHSAKFDNEKLSENIKNAIQRYNITHPVVNDVDITLWDNLGIECWPTLVLFSPNGRVIATIIGEGHFEELRILVATALKHYHHLLNNDPILYQPLNNVSRILSFPGKVSSDGAVLYVADSGHHRLLVVELSSGAVLNVIGCGEAGLKDGTFKEACFSSPQGIAHYSGNLYVADTGNHVVRMVDLSRSTVTTLVGTGKQGNDKEGGLCGTQQELSSPWDIVLGCSPGSDQTDLLYIAMAGTHQIWAYFLEDVVWMKGRSYPATTAIFFSGSGEEANRNNSYAHKASFAQPSGLAATVKQDKLFVADSESSTIRIVSCKDGSVKALVGGALDPQDLFAFGDKDGKGRDVKLQHPLAVVCNDNTLYIADSYNHKIKQIDVTSKNCSTLAGLGKACLKDGEFPEAGFSEPGGLCLSGDKLYVADTNNHCIRVMDLHNRSVTQLSLHYQQQQVEQGQEVKRITGARAIVKELEPVNLIDDGIVMEFTLLIIPHNEHLNSEAPSRYQILAGKVLVAKGSIEDIVTTSPKLSSLQDIQKLEVEVVIYVCEESGTCKVHQFVYHVPLHHSTSVTVQQKCIKLKVEL